MDEGLKEIAYSLEKYNRAVARLKEAIEEEKSSLKIDATIQRFEFTFELAWKTLKRVLIFEGEICKTPRECLKNGFRLGLIEDEDTWLSMLDDRNAMAHVYDEETVNEIFIRISSYYPVFNRLCKELKSKFTGQAPMK